MIPEKLDENVGEMLGYPTEDEIDAQDLHDMNKALANEDDYDEDDEDDDDYDEDDDDYNEDDDDDEDE